VSAQGEQTLWLLISATLLTLAVLGVALFYGGMVRRKNIMNTIALPFVALAVVSFAWSLFGNGWAAWHGIGPGPDHQDWLRSVSRGMMASIALALVAGGVVERIRFSFFFVFGLCWVAAVFVPLAQSIWGGGWLTNLGSLDYAGGAVIHISAGVSALVLAVMIGPRQGYGRIDMMPNHLPLSFCGAAFMWVGWFGFTGVSPSMAAATSAFVAIQLSTIAAALAWMAVEWLQRDRPTALGAMSGAVAGLVAIASGAGYVGPSSALVIGVGAGALCYMVVNYVKLILGYDDSLDVFGIHGVAGTWGMMATGLFASTEVNADGSDGLFYGYPYQFFAQTVATLVTWVMAGAITWLLVKALALLMTPRVDEEGEAIGLDLHQHGEKGYSSHA
jgi:Amt family ammonium transporter